MNLLTQAVLSLTASRRTTATENTWRRPGRDVQRPRHEDAHPGLEHPETEVFEVVKKLGDNVDVIYMSGLSSSSMPRSHQVFVCSPQRAAADERSFVNLAPPIPTSVCVATFVSDWIGCPWSLSPRCSTRCREFQVSKRIWSSIQRFLPLNISPDTFLHMDPCAELSRVRVTSQSYDARLVEVQRVSPSVLLHSDRSRILDAVLAGELRVSRAVLRRRCP